MNESAMAPHSHRATLQSLKIMITCN